MAQDKRLHAKITGRVQGVGFRYFVSRCANQLGIVGSVRNLADGSVEVIAEADEPTLQKLLTKLRDGPSMAWVEAVNVQWQAPRHNLDGFVIESTTHW